MQYRTRSYLEPPPPTSIGLHLLHERCITLAPIIPIKEVWKTHTSINLHHLRQRQPHLIPIQRRLRPLQRVSLKVHSLELLLICQLALHLAEISEFTVTRPELGEVGESLEPAQVLDGVGADVDDG